MFNDKDIIQGLLSNNERLINKTLEKLYNEFRPMVRKIVLSNSGNLDDVSDVIQEGVLSFYTNVVLSKIINIKDNLIVNKSNDVVKISSYMYSVFRNIWFLRLRLKKFQSNQNPFLFSDDFVEEDVFEYENLFAKRKKVYFESLKNLDEKCKEILNLFWHQKMSFNDIAIIMNHSNSKTSKQIKSRCQKKLKEMCNKELVYEN